MLTLTKWSRDARVDTLIPREKEKVPILRGTGVPFGCPQIVHATGVMKIKGPTFYLVNPAMQLANFPVLVFGCSVSFY
jgi:hypothetical protein